MNCYEAKIHPEIVFLSLHGSRFLWRAASYRSTTMNNGQVGIDG